MPQVSGREILQNALEPITGAYDHSPAVEDLDVLSRRSKFVIDSANLSPELLGQRAQEFRGTLLRGENQLRWGADTGAGAVYTVNADRSLGAVSEDLPIDISRWTYQYSDGAGTERIPYLDRPATTEEWTVRRAAYRADYRSYPQMLRFVQNETGGVYPLLFWPTVDREYIIRLYAVVPALSMIHNNETPMDLPQGVAAYLSAALTVDGCKAFGFPVRPEMLNDLHAAAERLAGKPETKIQRVSSPRWLVGDRYDFERFGGF